MRVSLKKNPLQVKRQPAARFATMLTTYTKTIRLRGNPPKRTAVIGTTDGGGERLRGRVGVAIRRVDPRMFVMTSDDVARLRPAYHKKPDPPTRRPLINGDLLLFS
jgi:hypothetical protein